MAGELATRLAYSCRVNPDNWHVIDNVLCVMLDSGLIEFELPDCDRLDVRRPLVITIEADASP